MSREPNTHECSYYGRKLSCFSCDDIEVKPGYLVIGSESDDSIYWDDNYKIPGDMIKERVKIIAIDDGHEDLDFEGHYVEIDLEDVLRFAANNCRGIYERVLKEVEPKDWRE